ncbi:MAG: hypothetical protein REI94_04985 [Moraxellaceae bacterium]|nr:hypothetical protein [Moraxellaceae bacterium]
MPLKSGASRSAISQNVRGLLHEYEETGEIGTSHPPDRQRAVKQAVAIALRKAGVSRTQPRKRASQRRARVSRGGGRGRGRAGGAR